MRTATIFVNDARLLRRERPNVGIRFDTQVLPRGSRAVGFLTLESSSPQQPIGVSDTDWAEALRYAGDVLEGRWQSDGNYGELL